MRISRHVNLEPLSGLLSPALRRAGIERAVLAAQTVAAAENWLTMTLPENTRASAKALCLKDNKLHFACTNASVRQFVEERASLLEAHVARTVPRASVGGVFVRLVANLP
jgi:hypothetical protein